MKKKKTEGSYFRSAELPMSSNSPSPAGNAYGRNVYFSTKFQGTVVISKKSTKNKWSGD